jgi:Holliday junction resolvasome RuvABC endonuclease subunit
VLVAVEAYAFHKQSSSVTVLAELGGVMRNKLHRAGLQFVELSPTTIKRWFTGSGSADKQMMWDRFKAVTRSTLALDTLIPGSFARQIPSPHQDIVDSFASAFSLHRGGVVAIAAPTE